jgi:hypothetical protein
MYLTFHYANKFGLTYYIKKNKKRKNKIKKGGKKPVKTIIKAKT